MICINEFKNQNISAFSLKEKLNSHSECEIRINIGDADHTDFLNQLGKTLSIKNDREFVFRGIIDRLTEEKRYSGNILTVHSVSQSIKTDTQKHKRIFQDPDKKLSDIIAFIDRRYGGRDGIKLCGEDKKITKCVIQNDETDFEFLNRLARENGYRTIVRSDDSNIDILVGEYNNYSNVIDLEDKKEYCEKIEISDIYESGTSVNLVLRDDPYSYIPLGRKIRYNEKYYYVDSLAIAMERSTYKYKYVLFETDNKVQISDSDFPLIMLKGNVSNTDDPEHKGRIQVRFDCDYDEVKSDRLAWIPVETPYTASKGGIYFIPDVNDRVDVKYINGKLYASMSFGSKEIDRKFQNTSDKYISNVNGKWIGLKENSLEICSGDNVSITLNDNDIKLKVKDTCIILSDNEIKVNIKGTNITLSDRIEAKCSGDIVVKANNISQKASAAMEIRGSKIELN